MSKWSKLISSMGFKVQVGKDLTGNTYYLHEKSGRRFVKFARNEDLPSSLPVQWQSWLNKRREFPPSLEDLMEAERKQDDLQRKIKELEEKEQKSLLQFGILLNSFLNIGKIITKFHQEQCTIQIIQIPKCFKRFFKITIKRNNNKITIKTNYSVINDNKNSK